MGKELAAEALASRLMVDATRPAPRLRSWHRANRAVISNGEALQLLRKVLLIVRRDTLHEVDVLRRVKRHHLIGGRQVWPEYLRTKAKDFP